MQFSLLALRLHLQYFSVAPPPDPSLHVGTDWVNAHWTCGCSGSGPDFETMSFEPCFTHDRIRPIDASQLIAHSRHAVDSRRGSRQLTR